MSVCTMVWWNTSFLTNYSHYALLIKSLSSAVGMAVYSLTCIIVSLFTAQVYFHIWQNCKIVREGKSH